MVDITAPHLKTVSFLAKSSSSSPGPKTGEGLAQLIALFNFLGVVWILWATPALAFFLATCAAAISLQLRRNFWAKAFSLGMSYAIAIAFIVSPPALVKSSLPSRHQPAEQIRTAYREADRRCERFGDFYDCLDRQRLGTALRDATRKPEAPATPLPREQEVAFFIISFVALLILHQLAAGQSEQIFPTLPLPPLPLPPFQEDPDADKLKQRDFDAWMALGGVIRHETPEPSMRLQEVHSRYAKWIKEQPGATSFDIASFQKALKIATNKEMIKVGSETVVPGISFSSTSLI